MREVGGDMVLHGKKRGCGNMEIAKGSSVYIEALASDFRVIRDYIAQ
jgi:hypothetical protein